ncbi:MAG: hypothetical protein U9R47_09950 [Actinomycetota bacterium]|nr:hypothetical protein [Actinomycetota bacterium]
MWGGFIVVVSVGVGIVVFGAPWPENDLGPLLIVIIGVVAVVDFGSVFWLRSMGEAAILKAESNDDIRRAYARRMLLACSFSITPAFVAFVFVLVAGTTAAFYIVAVLALVALVISGPRRIDIERLDERMIDAGRPFRASAALDS